LGYKAGKAGVPVTEADKQVRISCPSSAGKPFLLRPSLTRSFDVDEEVEAEVV